MIEHVAVHAELLNLLLEGSDDLPEEDRALRRALARVVMETASAKIRGIRAAEAELERDLKMAGQIAAQGLLQ